MGIVEQLQLEASEQAGSFDGIVRLIHLLFEEVEKIDTKSPDFLSQYTTFIRAYVMMKRQLRIFRRRCEDEEVNQDIYDKTIRRLDSAILLKKAEVLKYAKERVPPEKLKEANRYAGTHLAFGHRELDHFPPPIVGVAYADTYREPCVSTRSYNRM